MSSSAELLRQRVQAIMPELNIEHFERNHEGLINDVVIVNQNLVFRLAKTVLGADSLSVEMRVLDLIRPHIGNDVPAPVRQTDDSCVYPLLSGQPLTREVILGLSEAAQRGVVDQLGEFLYRLHTTNVAGLDWPIPATRAPVTRDQWLDLRQRVHTHVYPLLLKHQLEWAERLFDSVLQAPASFEYKPALIHGDLAPYHILFDAANNRVSGVIDFGVAGLGDAASDFGSLIGIYGESFVTRMQTTYPDMAKYLPRARFYAQSIELQWALLGIETGEAFWFTAHLGGARDIHN